MKLSAQTIRRLCEADKPLIAPFVERGVQSGMSYGLSSHGYDIRIAQSLSLGPGEFVLASTVERFALPNDLCGVVYAKSTWKRQGLSVGEATVLEAGWEGWLTLELHNHSRERLRILAGDPIAQVMFDRLDEPTEQPYGPQNKYQDQPARPVKAILES